MKNQGLIVGLGAVVVLVAVVIGGLAFMASQQQASNANLNQPQNTVRDTIVEDESSISETDDTQPEEVEADTNESSSDTIFTVSEIATHNNASSCYIAFAGDVYDITPFVSIHPGGSQILSECGREVDDFSSMHPGGQFSSAQVQAQIGKYKIGKVE